MLKFKQKIKFDSLFRFVIAFISYLSFADFSEAAEEKSQIDKITGGFRFSSSAIEKEGRWKVEGDQARFLSADVIEITPVRAIVYGSKEPDLMIKAEWANLNRTTKEIWTDSAVEITKGNSKLTGQGLRWITASKKVTILKNIKMTVDMEETGQWQKVE